MATAIILAAIAATLVGLTGLIRLLERDLRSKTDIALSLLRQLADGDQTASMELREELHARNLQLNELDTNFKLLLQEVRGETKKARASEERARHHASRSEEETEIEASNSDEWPPQPPPEAAPTSDGRPLTLEARLFRHRHSRHRS